MKPIVRRAANRRNDTLDRQRRDRAASQVMRDRFPGVASLRLEFEFSDSSPFPPVPQVTVLHPPARTYFFFPCPYSDCDGEFDVSEPIAQLLRGNEAQAEGQMTCCGQRVRDKEGHSACGLLLEYVIAVQRE